MRRFSALQRAEIAEIPAFQFWSVISSGFSALQRAEIAEIPREIARGDDCRGFSALQRAEIAEIEAEQTHQVTSLLFQCSSTSRNC